MAKLRITYTKSAIGYSQDQKDTVRSLGLRKLNSTALHDDTPSIRGMAFKVRHLVQVEELAEEAAVKPAKAATVRPVKKATLVRSQVAEEPVETEVPPVVDAPAVAKTLAVVETPEVAETPAQTDDLELIEGIGPKIAGVLKAAGIVTFADLAAADTSRLAEILEQEPNLRSANPGTWPEQAALAAAGDWDGLKALTEQLKGGRRA